MTPETSPFPLVDNFASPDTFADQVTSFHIHQGVMRLVLEKFRLNVVGNSAPASRVVIGTLFMPTEAAEVMAKGMLEFIRRNREPVSTATAALVTPPGQTIN